MYNFVLFRRPKNFDYLPQNLIAAYCCCVILTSSSFVPCNAFYNKTESADFSIFANFDIRYDVNN